MAAFRRDKIPRPNSVAVKISVVIKNARIVATFIPDINKYNNNPNHAHIIDGYLAGILFVIGAIDLKIK